MGAGDLNAEPLVLAMSSSLTDSASYLKPGERLLAKIIGSRLHIACECLLDDVWFCAGSSMGPC
jgi:hypothetical protein